MRNTSKRATSFARSSLLSKSGRNFKLYGRSTTRLYVSKGKSSSSLFYSTLTSSSSSSSSSFSSSFSTVPLLLGAAAGLYLATSSSSSYHAHTTDWNKIREEIKSILHNPNYDDGSYGPLLIRLAWHASGTYDKADHTGGSGGGTMRFKHEASDGANAGLQLAIDLLEPIKKRHPEISYGDLWTFAGTVAIEEMGGHKVNWRPGRKDKDEKACVAHGRLPDAAQAQQHIRDVFYRMGFNDREIVALAGAHALGRCHTDRSGYDGPWTSSPITLTNEYFVLLLESKWTPKKWNGPLQYEDESKSLMMLPADLAFVQDPKFKEYVELYAKDEELWKTDFSAAWKKLIELGVNFSDEKPQQEQHKSWWSKLFG